MFQEYARKRYEADYNVWQQLTLGWMYIFYMQDVKLTKQLYRDEEIHFQALHREGFSPAQAFAFMKDTMNLLPKEGG